MYKSSVILSLLPLFLSSIQASPTTAQGLDTRDSGPSINVIFFSDDNCTHPVPATIYTRPVFGDEACYIFPAQLYRSLLIDEIDAQFVGTNSALQVGNTPGDTCGWGTALKYSIATRDTVGECQFVGIPSGPGQPLKGGNEYRLTSLEG
jgi:hypothetical protein